MSRKITCKLIEMMDEGIITPRAIAMAALDYMSEADVAEMAHSEGFIVEDEDQDE